MPRWRAYRLLEWFIFVGFTMAAFFALVAVVMLTMGGEQARVEVRQQPQVSATPMAPNSEISAVPQPISGGLDFWSYRDPYLEIHLGGGGTSYVGSSSNMAIMVVDSEGRQTGIDGPAGRVLFDIPNSGYQADADRICAPDGSGQCLAHAHDIFVSQPAVGRYQIKVTGTEVEHYDLRITVSCNGPEETRDMEVPGLANRIIQPGKVDIFTIGVDCTSSTPLNVISVAP